MIPAAPPNKGWIEVQEMDECKQNDSGGQISVTPPKREGDEN
jgi:hypothetical protein